MAGRITIRISERNTGVSKEYVDGELGKETYQRTEALSAINSALNEISTKLTQIESKVTDIEDDLSRRTFG